MPLISPLMPVPIDKGYVLQKPHQESKGFLWENIVDTWPNQE